MVGGVNLASWWKHAIQGNSVDGDVGSCKTSKKMCMT